jgi:ribonucleoside-diphosphate reductase alpha subunit
VVQFTSPREVAVCNLARIALPRFVAAAAAFDFTRLHAVVRRVTRSLNAVIDANFYPVPEAETSNRRHRPIGIGVQGLADVFVLLGMPFDSEEARALNRDIFETIYHAALEESAALARAYGCYETFAGSPASDGELQFDMWGVCPSARYNWDALRAEIAYSGLRNSLLVAPMPTASTSQILGHTECFEPFGSNLYVRRTLTGDFTVLNPHLVRDLEARGLWSLAMRDRLLAHNGSVQHIPEIPPHLRAVYRTVWEIPARSIVDMAAERAPYICQSQSLNLHMAEPSVDRLSNYHRYAWARGLKTGMYYLRTRAAVDPTKFTLSAVAVAAARSEATSTTLPAQSTAEPTASPACTREAGCEACGA